jgi:hypothetical protein
MPYACAHPAAVIPLSRLLGKLAVPSALAIGSVIPDAWYFLPLLKRTDSHSLLGLVLFCLPAGLFAYAAFHLICKEPLLALLPRGLVARAGVYACAGLPRVPWRAVAASLLAGALTHNAWDALTHESMLTSALQLDFRLLQHASTVLGTLIVAAWLARKLSTTPPYAAIDGLSTRVRAIIAAIFLVVLAGAFCAVLLLLPGELDRSALRSLVRAAGVTSCSALGFAFLAYCLLFRSISARASRTGLDQREPM